MRFYLDIETVPLPADDRAFAAPTWESIKFGTTKDPEKRKAKYANTMKSWDTGESCALDAHTGKIALVCIAHTSGEAQSIYGEEHEIIMGLREIFKGVTTDDQIVGHDIRRFDAPFILRRAMVNQIRMPVLLGVDLYQYRPKIWTDTLIMWSLGDRQTKISLEHLAGALGIAMPESTVKSAEFHKHWAKDQDACIQHCINHVEVTREVYTKMQGEF